MKGDNELIMARIPEIRKDQYAVATYVRKNGIKKIAMNEFANEHIRNIYCYSRILKDNGINVIEYVFVKEGMLEAEYVDAPTLEEVIIDMIFKDCYAELKQVYNAYYQLLEEAAKLVKGKAFIDMIPDNIFVKKSELYVYDQEYVMADVNIMDIAGKGIVDMYYRHPNIANNIPMKKLLDFLELDCDPKRYFELNKRISKMVYKEF